MQITTLQPISSFTRVPFGAGQSAINVLSLIKPERMRDSFIQLARKNTMSFPNPTSYPSSPGQRLMAAMLADELRRLGLKDVMVDKDCLVTGTYPTNIKTTARVPTVGLISHMDTSDAAPCEDIQPQIHFNYPGGDLPVGHGIVIPAADLAKHIGEDIITSDGRTLLGADDKAGIAEILEVLNVYQENPSILRPNIRVAFTPDEENSNYIDTFNLQTFGADAAYTVDGEEPEALETESFNAHKIEITIHGKDSHPGDAKGNMVSAVRISADLINRIPKNQIPEAAEGREGFYYVKNLTAATGAAQISILIRDFDFEQSLKRVKKVENILKRLEKKYPGCTIEHTVFEEYRNMSAILKQHPEAVNNALEGIRRTGLHPVEKTIRGGTDGSNLTQAGLPTPNLPTGAQNFHRKHEFVTVQDMTKCAANIINTLSVWAEGVLKGIK